MASQEFVSINAHGLQMPLADVFVAKVRSDCQWDAFPAQALRTGDPAIVYSDYMSEPAQASLLQQCEHAEDFSPLQDSVVGDFAR